MPFYSDVDVNTRERVNLSPDSYGSGKQAGLKIVSYIGEKPDKSDHVRHSFLVTATRPGRDALQRVAAAANGNGKGSNPLDEPDYEGTAFLALTLDDLWLAPESIALAFTEASRNKAGEIQKDYEKMSLEDKSVTEESLQKCREHFQGLARDKVIAANTPEESLEEAFRVQYRKELQQVAIKVGQFFVLQDWKNGGDKSKRDPQLNPMELAGTEFSGKVEHTDIGKGGSEVTAVYSVKESK